MSSAGANRLVLSWDAKTGTKQYKVQISKREDFNPSFETKTTDNPDWAPTLTNSNYTSGGDFCWRVAAIDGDGNVGAYATNPETSRCRPSAGGGGPSTKQFKVTFSGRLVKNRARDVTVKVRDSVDPERRPGRLRPRLRRRRLADAEDDELERRREVPPQADPAGEGHLPGGEVGLRHRLSQAQRLQPVA